MRVMKVNVGAIRKVQHRPRIVGPIGVSGDPAASATPTGGTPTWDETTRVTWRNFTRFLAIGLTVRSGGPTVTVRNRYF